MKYTVWSLDVWGHSPLNCDDNACQCGYDVNDRFRVGSVEIPDTATDAELLEILENDGYIHADKCAVDDFSDGTVIGIDSKSTGRPLLMLEVCEP